MRSVCLVLLTLIAVFGLAIGVALAFAAWHPGADSLGLEQAFAAGAVPFLAGTVALGAAAIVMAIERPQ